MQCCCCTPTWLSSHTRAIESPSPMSLPCIQFDRSSGSTNKLDPGDGRAGLLNRGCRSLKQHSFVPLLCPTSTPARPTHSGQYSDAKCRQSDAREQNHARRTLKINGQCCSREEGSTRPSVAPAVACGSGAVLWRTPAGAALRLTAAFACAYAKRAKPGRAEAKRQL